MRVPQSTARAPGLQRPVTREAARSIGFEFGKPLREKIQQGTHRGQQPRRDANTACTISRRGAQSGSTITSSPRATSSRTIIVGNCTMPTPATAAARSASMPPVTKRGW